MIYSNKTVKFAVWISRCLLEIKLKALTEGVTRASTVACFELHVLLRQILVLSLTHVSVTI